MFSPFQKPLDELAAPDLARLREVSEGWYVEYKRELPNAKSIAKSVAALANTYGGWVFYGVAELSKEDPVAGDFPGIAVGEVDQGLQRIRQAVAGQLNPAAHFDARVVEGDDGPDLAVGRAVLCVRVPQSLAAPHVHASGHIYRRVADGSEPRPENDRHLLDQLFRRADELRDDFRSWVDQDPEFSKGEGEAPYLRLMMVVDPWRAQDPFLDIDLAELRGLFNSPPLVSSVPFDTVYTTARGFVARQLDGSDPHHLGPTWSLRRSVVSDVVVPLRLYAVDDMWELEDRLHGYEQAGRFVELLKARGYGRPRIVDLNILFNLMVAVVETQRRILARAGWTAPYFMKARLLNVWRTVPFLDVEPVVARFEEFGLPMCLEGVVTSPPGSDPDTFEEVPTDEEEGGDKVAVLVQALQLFASVARAWGLPVDLGADAVPPYFLQLQAAGARAIDVQARQAAEAKENDSG